MTSRMVGSVLTLVILLFSVVGGAAQTYTQMQWGMNKAVTPYAFGANINGTWRDLGTVSTNGIWTLYASGFTPITAYTACNGVANDSAGFLAAAASNNNIYVPSGATCTISTNTTIPTGSAWTVQKGATINVATGVTLKFRALFNAGRYTVFGGLGSVIGIAQTKPEWWGAQGAFGNSFDSRAAFQAAVNSALAAFDPGAPTVFSDTDGTPSVDIGQGFFNLCSPVDVYPNSSKPIAIRGIGPWNSGSWIQTCNTFTGYAPFLVHGTPVAQGQVNYVVFSNLSINNPVKASGATAGIRFVPEGDGYWIQALQKSSLVENVKITNFPIGIDVVNTFKVVFSRVGISEAGANTSDNTGIRFYADGAVSSGNTLGEIVVENAQIDACPLANALTCSNTIGVDMQSLGGAAVNSINFKSTVFYSSNTYVKMTASGKDGSNKPSWIGDIWFAGDGNQMDGFGCNFINANASDSGQIFNVHVDHVYHTGSYSGSCVIHNWNNAGTGSPISRVFNIWDTNNQFVMGSTGTIIRGNFADSLIIEGNVLSGSSVSADAVALVNTSNSVISNNIVMGAPNWRFGISLGSGTTNTMVTGNECKGSGGFIGACIVDATSASTTTNNRYGNSDGVFSPIQFNNDTSGTITLKAPNSGALGSSVATLPINTGTIAETNLAQTFSATQTFSLGVISAGTAPTATGSGGTCAAGAVTGGALVGTVALTGVCAATDTLALTSMPAATTGYVCDAADRTTGAVNLVQTATTTTGATFTFNASTGATDVIQFKCLGY